MKTITINRTIDTAGVYATVLYEGNNVGHASLNEDGNLNKSYYLQAFINTYTGDERKQLERKITRFCKRLE